MLVFSKITLFQEEEKLEVDEVSSISFQDDKFESNNDQNMMINQVESDFGHRSVSSYQIYEEEKSYKKVHESFR